jgi:hypothetical protein
VITCQLHGSILARIILLSSQQVFREWQGLSCQHIVAASPALKLFGTPSLLMPLEATAVEPELSCYKVRRVIAKHLHAHKFLPNFLLFVFAMLCHVQSQTALKSNLASPVKRCRFSLLVSLHFAPQRNQVKS